LPLLLDEGRVRGSMDKYPKRGGKTMKSTNQTGKKLNIKTMIFITMFLLIIAFLESFPLTAGDTEYYELWIVAHEGGTTNPSPGSFLCMPNTLFIATAIPDPGWIFDHWELNSVHKGAINPIEVKMDENYLLEAFFIPKPKNEYIEVPLKFFILYPNMTSKFNCSALDKLIYGVNKIYRCQCHNDIVFYWSNKNRTRCSAEVVPGNLTNLPNNETLAGLKALPNCSKGINVVFVPNNYPGNWLGWTHFYICGGKPPLGVKIRDSCNWTEMTLTLAHELLHALGLSHEQFKNCPKDPPGPHAYTGECLWHAPDCKRHRVRFYNGWDVNRDCRDDDLDRGYLLWGDTRQTGTLISPQQCDYIWKSARKIPCRRIKQYCTYIPKVWPSAPVFGVDDISDVPPGFGHVDIFNAMATNYYDPTENRCSLSFEVTGNMLINKTLTYGFYLDTDGDNETGSPDGILQGADFAAILDVVPGLIEASLWKYEGGWTEVQTLNWSITNAEVDIMPQEKIDAPTEVSIRRNTAMIDVPLGSLNLVFDKVMQIRMFATDCDDDITDLSPLMSLPLEIDFPPLINLSPTSGPSGQNVTIDATGFTPYTNITIEFDGALAWKGVTDDSGGLACSIEVPVVPRGYYPITAYDEAGKFDLAMFIVTPYAIHMHSTDGQIDLRNPKCTYWRWIYPASLHGKLYHLTSWLDNCDSKLSRCDYIDMHDMETGTVYWFKVESVTKTLKIIKKPELTQVSYVEFEGTYEELNLTSPICTQWHEIYPCYSRSYHLSSWHDTNSNGILDIGDQIDMKLKPCGPVEWYYVEEMATDIKVSLRRPGDVTLDGKVNIYDVVAIATAYGSNPGKPNWNPYADIARPYYKVDIYDIVSCIYYYEP